MSKKRQPRAQVGASLPRKKILLPDAWDRGTFDVYLNPSDRQLLALGLNGDNNVRGLILEDDVYLWHAADAVHDYTRHALGLPAHETIQAYLNPNPYNDLLTVTLTGSFARAPTDWFTHPYFAAHPKIFSPANTRFEEMYRKLDIHRQDWESAKAYRRQVMSQRDSVEGIRHPRITPVT